MRRPVSHRLTLARETPSVAARAPAGLLRPPESTGTPPEPEAPCDVELRLAQSPVQPRQQRGAALLRGQGGTIKEDGSSDCR